MPSAVHVATDACITGFGLIVKELVGAICARLATEIVRYLHFALARGQPPRAARLATRRPCTPIVWYTVNLAIVSGGIIITLLNLRPCLRRALDTSSQTRVIRSVVRIDAWSRWPIGQALLCQWLPACGLRPALSEICNIDRVALSPSAPSLVTRGSV